MDIAWALQPGPFRSRVESGTHLVVHALLDHGDVGPADVGHLRAGHVDDDPVAGHPAVGELHHVEHGHARFDGLHELEARWVWVLEGDHEHAVPFGRRLR